METARKQLSRQSCVFVTLLHAQSLACASQKRAAVQENICPPGSCGSSRSFAGSARDEDGRVRRVLATIVSGFICRGRFYTRKAAARAMSVGNPG